MSIITMQQINFNEAERLLKIIQKYSVNCSLEFKVEEESDPLLGIVQASITVDYFEDENEKRYLLVELDKSYFSFSENKSTFHKYVSDCQIDVCISSDKFSALFSSGELSEQAVLEARD